MPSLEEREARLRALLAEMGSVAIGFSGGVDSTYLVAVAHQVLGQQAVAVTARSAIMPARELNEAVKLAAAIGVRQILIDTDELDDPAFVANPSNRCYICKGGLFNRMAGVARELGLRWLAHGENVDDQLDYRPGSQAAELAGARAPLREAGLTKADIRELSRRLDLPTWDKPAAACLATRLPYGMTITPERLAQVEAAEELLLGLGFRQCRVRHHGDTARLELPETALAAALEHRGPIVSRLKDLGFTYISLDLQGYRTGSMNERLQGG